jgi:SPP1 gp7 family putative phage head morphogenesis protein
MPITQEFELTPLPPKEAMSFFKGKVLLKSKEYYALIDKAKAKAFTVSRVASMDILSDLHAAVQAALDDGETLADFMSRLSEVMDRKGWGGITPWHAETVFRTNIQTAYSVQREEQYEGNKESFPLAQYIATIDDRTRDEHAELNGKIYLIDDPFWDVWTPPSGFSCRCSKRYIHKYEAEDRGLKVSAPIPAGLKPDKGFDVNPAKVEWEPEKKDYPFELWNQYKKGG